MCSLSASAISSSADEGSSLSGFSRIFRFASSGSELLSAVLWASSGPFPVYLPGVGGAGFRGGAGFEGLWMGGDCVGPA